MTTKKSLTEKATKVINETKLQALIAKKTSETMASMKDEVKEVKPKKQTVKKVTTKPVGKTEVLKETKKEVDKINKTTLVEEVISNREVKYVYPADCTDTLSRKSWRQKVRNKLHSLERVMFRIKDQESKEFKQAKKEYEEFYQSVCKPNVAV